MSESGTRGGVARLSKVVLSVLLGFVLIGSAFQLRAEGVAALPEVAASVYVAAVVAYGVLRDAMDTSRFRIALYAGVVAWAAVNLAGGATDVVTYALFAVGALLLARELTFGG
ncbi:hypothetical protein [Halegenticoccus soli]|uniref:hypothetical protein n=1 Tax=Halegenticoccus soli TaxID=1985678 RepID=UPI000C6D5E80|nr:hypothetical protein [Halegenticoccus soli]